MRSKLSIFAALVLVLAFSGCIASPKPSSSVAPPLASSQSEQEESSKIAPDEPKVYVQTRSGLLEGVAEEYLPMITLHNNGDFEFRVNLLEGMFVVEGSYTITETLLHLLVEVPVPKGFVGDSIEVFEFMVDGDELVYMTETPACASAKGDRFLLQ